MDGSSHNKPLPFSFKRPNFQNSTQKPRNNNNNIGPRKPANLTNEADSPQTQSFRLPENQTSISLKQPTGNINSISKPFFSLTPHLQSHSDSAPTSSRLRHPSSHIARPIFGSHAVKNKPSFKTELNENSAAMIQVGRRELSPFRGGYQAHTPAPLNDPKPEPELEGQVQEYPLDAVKQEQPFTLALLSNSPRLSSSNGQPSLPFSHSPSSSAYPVQNFPESPSSSPLIFTCIYRLTYHVQLPYQQMTFNSNPPISALHPLLRPCNPNPILCLRKHRPPLKHLTHTPLVHVASRLSYPTLIWIWIWTAMPRCVTLLLR